MLEVEPHQPLTNPDNWNEYYRDRGRDSIELAAEATRYLDSILPATAGSVFELGCGASGHLARCRKRGWQVGGIDFNPHSLGIVKQYDLDHGGDGQGFIAGDVQTVDITSLRRRYDVLMSFGFLEHFRNPASILEKWKHILKDDGIVLSQIPNLMSINGALLKKFDPVLWEQHVPFSPDEMDSFHLAAGLLPVEKARYYGKYDIYMLVPWERIQEASPRVLFKPLKYVLRHGIGRLLGLLPETGVRWFNSTVLGVYTLRGSSTGERS